MNVKRFTARTAREALAGVRQAFGEDAVVLSTKPCLEGIEVVAMAPESLAQFERVAAGSPTVRQAPAAPAFSAPMTAAARAEPSVAQDIGQLGMSTMSFQSYVRERMLKRREAALREEASEALAKRVLSQAPARSDAAAPQSVAPPVHVAQVAAHGNEPQFGAPIALPQAMVSDPTWFEPLAERAPQPVAARPAAPLPNVGLPAAPRSAAPSAEQAAAQRNQQAMMAELRQVKGLIEDRFGALAFMDKLQRHPAHARLTQRLLDCGFSAALIRKLAEHMAPSVTDEAQWAAGVLQRNLLTGEAEPAIEDEGGVYALVGATGVGKTTSTAKLAAAFAAKYGAAHLGLVTLDAYRVGAHEQLRAYGRILGVPVHTAHDKASLEDLLQMLAGKKMVLIDTAGMAQRDVRTPELLDMLDHASIKKLLVLNAAAQGETLEDVIVSYRAPLARGVILSKMDEAVKLAPALDIVIRHKLPVLGVANGQRVPEDWHRLSSHVLVHLAMRATAWSAYRFESEDLPLIFSAPQQHAVARGAGASSARAAYA
ncbi:MAG: flagellar biosynthesis protein FlhF [Burkholderiaceae bacterium]